MDVAPDHLQHFARCYPLLGIAELVWNALDADSTDVKIWFREGALGGVDRIQVVDNGEGIDITRIESAFQTLGRSWKRGKRTTTSGRSLHGQHGRGRFRACTLGRICLWETTNRAPTKDLYNYSVTINTDRLKEVETTCLNRHAGNRHRDDGNGHRTQDAQEPAVCGRLDSRLSHRAVRTLPAELSQGEDIDQRRAD